MDVELNKDGEREGQRGDQGQGRRGGVGPITVRAVPLRALAGTQGEASTEGQVTRTNTSAFWTQKQRREKGHSWLILEALHKTPASGEDGLAFRG